MAVPEGFVPVDSIPQSQGSNIPAGFVPVQSGAPQVAPEMSMGERMMGVLKSPIVGGAEQIANTLTGAQSGAPTGVAKAIYDWLAQSGMQQDVQRTIEAGGLPKYGAMAGGMIPMLAEFGVLSKLGRGAGMRMGKGLAPLGQQALGFAGSIAAPIPALKFPEAGAFKHALTQVGGFDPEVLDAIGDTHGWQAAALNSGLGLPMTDMAVQGVGARFGGSNMAGALLKTAGAEGAHIASGGIAGGLMAGLFNKNLDKAVEMQNARNKEKGLPPMDAEAITMLRQDASKAAQDMGTLTGLMRAPFVPFRAVGEVQAARMRSGEGAAKLTADIESGRPVAEMLPGLAPTESNPMMRLIPDSYKESLLLAPSSKEVEAKTQSFAFELDKMIDNKSAKVFKLAQQQGINIEGKTHLDLRQPLMEKMGIWEKEGPALVNGALTIKPVIIQKPDQYLVLKGQALDDITTRMFPDATDATTGAMTLNVTDMKRSAMAKVYGREISDVLMQPGLPETKLQEMVPAPKYAQYLTNLEGMARSKAREAKVIKAKLENDIVAAISDPSMLSKLSIDEKTRIGVNEQPVNGVQLNAIREMITPLQPLVAHIAKIFNKPELLDYYYAHRKAYAFMHNVLDLSGTYFDNQYKKLPAALRTNPKTREQFELLATWMGHDVEQRKLMNAELGLKDATVETYLKRVSDTFDEQRPGIFRKFTGNKSKFTDSEILTHADFLMKKKSALTNWYLANGIVPPEFAHKAYTPIFRMRITDLDKGGARVPFDQWLWENRNHRTVLETIGTWTDRNKPPAEFEDLLNLTMTMRKKIINDSPAPVPGARPASMERMREDPSKMIAQAELMDMADEGFIRQVSQLTDANQVMVLYASRAARRLAFGPLAEQTKVLIDSIERSPMDRGQKQAVMDVIQTMNEQMYGIPDAQTIKARKSKIPMINSPVAVHDWLFNTTTDLAKHPILNKFLGAPKYTDLSKVADTMMNFFYMQGLGIPFNNSIPIRNIIQQMPMAVSLFGTSGFMGGMKRFFTDPGMVKELMAMDLRPKKYFLDPQELRDLHGLSKLPQISMYAFSMSDVLSVFTSAAAAINQWDKLKKVASLTEGGMKSLTHQQVIDVLIRNKSMKDMPSALNVIGKDETRTSKKFWNGVPDPDIIKVVVSHLKQGDEQGAKDMFVRYASDLTNFVYGPGGTNEKWRGPGKRMLLMYMSWAPNYYSWLAKTGLKGMADFSKGKGGMLFQRAAQTLFWQWAFMGMYAGATGDKRVYRGLNPLVGQLPVNPVQGGQIGNLALAINKYLQDSAASDVAGTYGDDEEAMRLDQQGQRDWERMVKATGIPRIMGTDKKE